MRTQALHCTGSFCCVFARWCAPATGAMDGTVKLWEVSTRTNIATLQGETHPIESVAFSPDGTKLISASYGGTVLVWNLESANP